MRSSSDLAGAGSQLFHAIGVDVGGTKIAAGLVTFTAGSVCARRVFATNAERGGEAVLADVQRVAEELADQARASKFEIRALGLGVCELVDLTGNVASANCIDWQDAPIRERLSSLAPTVIEADVRAAALAEALFGAGKRFKVFLYVTVGTGISSCLVIEGRPFRGARGATGTIASSSLSSVCMKCGQVEGRSLEEIASGPGIVARYHERSSNRANVAEDVIAASRKGDPEAVATVRSAGEALGRTVGWLVNALDPEAVIVGGGLGLSGGIYWEALEASTRKQIWADLHRQLPVVPAGLGQNAGIVGAAATAWLQFGGFGSQS
jgi:glucokinase